MDTLVNSQICCHYTLDFLHFKEILTSYKLTDYYS